MKVIWVDDDIEGSMLPYVDELEDEGVKVIKISHPDKFINDYMTVEHDCIIMDIMMPIGQNLSPEETKFGYETGVSLIKLYQRKFPAQRIVIFSILPDDNVRQIAKSLDLEYRSKRNTSPDDFCKLIKKIAI